MTGTEELRFFTMDAANLDKLQKFRGKERRKFGKIVVQNILAMLSEIPIFYPKFNRPKYLVTNVP